MPRVPALFLLLCSFVVITAVLPTFALAAKAPVATTPGAWTKLSDRPGSPTDAPALARDTSGALHLVYTARATGDSVALRSRTLSVAGGWETPLTLVRGWRSLAAPDVVAIGANAYAFWAGLEPAGTPASGTGTAWSAQLDSKGWTRLLVPTTQSAGPADATTLSATAAPNGTPWVGWSTSDTFGLHEGFAPTGVETLTPAACCELGTNVEADRKSGDVFTATRSTAPGAAGVSLRRIAPTVAAPIVLPESSFNGASVARATRIPMAARTTEGVFVAYCASVPKCTKIRVTNQSQRSLTFAPKVAVRPESIAISAGPEGRIWLTWTDVQKQVWGTRSNRATTRWGTPTRLVGPRGLTNAWHAAAEGSSGPLDVVLNASTAGTPGGATYLWYTRLRPALTLAPIPPVVRDGTMKVIRVQVTDAGDKVRSIVSFRGAERKTTSAGIATLVVPPDTAPGRYPLIATSTGYASAAGTLIVR